MYSMSLEEQSNMSQDDLKELQEKRQRHQADVQAIDDILNEMRQKREQLQNKLDNIRN